MLERFQLLLRRFLSEPVLRWIEGFWATPLIVSLVGLLLALLVQVVPEQIVGERWIGFFGTVDIAGARSAMSVVAGGMISLIALVFSLTFVALSNTAQQLSPRILDFVLQERSAQVLLGLALGTFLFATVVLSLGEVRGGWRLGLAILPALILAAATLVMVVVFAHAMTRVMRAEDMVARLGAQFVAEIHRILEPPVGCRRSDDDPADFELQFQDAAEVMTNRAGYVGMIDYEEVLEFAGKGDLKISLDVRESQFLLPKVRVARILGLHPDADDPAPMIESALNLTDRREATDTGGYEAAALCEAALRALSPGINDPATAISCLNRLFEGMAVLARSAPPPRLLAGPDDVPRLLRPAREAPEFLSNAVVPILDAGSDNARIVQRIATLARELDSLAERPRDHAAIAELIERLEHFGTDGDGERRESGPLASSA